PIPGSRALQLFRTRRNRRAIGRWLRPLRPGRWTVSDTRPPAPAFRARAAVRSRDPALALEPAARALRGGPLRTTATSGRQRSLRPLRRLLRVPKRLRRDGS